jgi:hypothetical protein
MRPLVQRDFIGENNERSCKKQLTDYYTDGGKSQAMHSALKILQGHRKASRRNGRERVLKLGHWRSSSGLQENLIL